jgi:hypothetical protein
MNSALATRWSLDEVMEDSLLFFFSPHGQGVPWLLNEGDSVVGLGEEDVKPSSHG